jgi:hypothetical protein
MILMACSTWSKKKNALMDNMKLSYSEIQKRLNAVEEGLKRWGTRSLR